MRIASLELKEKGKRAGRSTNDLKMAKELDRMDHEQQQQRQTASKLKAKGSGNNFKAFKVGAEDPSKLMMGAKYGMYVMIMNMRCVVHSS